MCLRKTKLPRKSRIVDRAGRSRTGTAVIAGDQDNLCACLCNAGCDRTDSRLGYQFHGDARITVRIL